MSSLKDPRFIALDQKLIEINDLLTLRLGGIENLLKPKTRAYLFNMPVSASTNLFGSSLLPTTAPCTFIVQFSLSGASTLTLIRKNKGTSVTENLFTTDNLSSIDQHVCSFLVNLDDEINFQSSSAVTIYSFTVIELSGAYPLAINEVLWALRKLGHDTGDSTTFDAQQFTNVALGIGATYTETAINVNLFRGGFFSVTAYADQAGTAYIDQSTDNANWDYSSSVAVVGGTGSALKVAIVAKYIRPRYVNGAVAQGTFRFGGRFSIA